MVFGVEGCYTAGIKQDLPNQRIDKGDGVYPTLDEAKIATLHEALEKGLIDQGALV